jgi:hypothetical protein
LDKNLAVGPGLDIFTLTIAIFENPTLARDIRGDVVKYAHFRTPPKMCKFDHINRHISGQGWILKTCYGEGKYISSRDPQLNFFLSRSSSLLWRGAATCFEAPLFLMRSHLIIDYSGYDKI